MRLSNVAVALLILTLSSIAGAVPKTPTKSEQTVIDKLDNELTGHQMKQASFAALKVAKQLYELTKQGWGDDAPETTRVARRRSRG